MVAVTRPSFEGVIHFQKTTGCAIWKLFIFDFISKLKICRLSPVDPATVAFSAITLEAGFINAESAVMGRFNGVNGAARSTMTTELDGPVSRMHMNLSLSIVTLVKEINCWLIPRLGSCKNKQPLFSYCMCFTASMRATRDYCLIEHTRPKTHGNIPRNPDGQYEMESKKLPENPIKRTESYAKACLDVAYQQGLLQGYWRCCSHLGPF